MKEKPNWIITRKRRKEMATFENDRRSKQKLLNQMFDDQYRTLYDGSIGRKGKRE
jgi:hypothetical protein